MGLVVASASARGHYGHGAPGTMVVNMILVEGRSQAEDRDSHGGFRRLGEVAVKWGLRAGPVG